MDDEKDLLIDVDFERNRIMKAAEKLQKANQEKLSAIAAELGDETLEISVLDGEELRYIINVIRRARMLKNI